MTRRGGLEQEARQLGWSPLGYTTQDRFLIANGILECFEQTAVDDARDPRRVKRRLQAMQLIHPQSMGRRFKVIALGRGLPPGAAWWSRMAFYPERSRSSKPEFELGARYRADGIADRITQHFDDFSLEVRLDTIEILPTPDC